MKSVTTNRNLCWGAELIFSTVPRSIRPEIQGRTPHRNIAFFDSRELSDASTILLEVQPCSFNASEYGAALVRADATSAPIEWVPDRNGPTILPHGACTRRNS